MRKIASLILVLVLLLSSNIAMAEAVTTTVIDRTKLSNGVLGINYEAGEKKTKLMIEKDGQKYIYDVYSVKETQRFPLQLGNGEYTVSILENTVDNKYRFVSKDSVRVNVENEHQVYLNSVQNINWNEEMEAIKKARELTKKAKSDEEKIKIIYDISLTM
ncbi:hypothetical protein [Caldalkalibacillus mannanilyticus]|uniref:hypothetical protein n=1 Tax=Caldalkalibacillus mannanilyticus TaxID=1418 RepID=UPI000686B650|nr:hypothetical protein [Caldalkalibacillus mannanilyticus]